jgi:tetratricopeptide repeat protein 7
VLDLVYILNPWFLIFPGDMHEVRDQIKDAVAAYFNALSTELEHVPSKASIGALLSKHGPKYLPVARCFLSDALRLEPTNRTAWFYLGKVHKLDGRLADAADCFQAASMLEDSDPVERFRLHHHNGSESSYSP